jgi:serine phosphatase RsbU (regulator of sigma subunit)
MRERLPSRVLATLNDAILRSEEDGRFCTVALAALEPGRGGALAEIACGGHPQPFVVRGDGEVHQAGALGMLLGSFPDPELADERLELAPGDSLVLYTDGLSERPGMTIVQSVERLTEVLHSWSHLGAEELAEKIEQWLQETDPETPRDDVALLVLRIAPPGAAV